MSIENKINNIVSNNGTNHEVLKNEPELITSYKKYEHTITKLKLSSLINTINSTPSIKNGMEDFVDNKLLEIDSYIDGLIDSGNLSGLNSVILRSTSFIETKINTFSTQANRVKRHNEKKVLVQKEAQEQQLYSNKKIELKNLLDNDFQNKLEYLEGLFKEEGKIQYYQDQYKIDNALGEDFKDIDEQYKTLSQTTISIQGIQNIFLNQGILLSEVNKEVLQIIDSSQYSTTEKKQKIENTINELKDFEKKIDEFIEKAKKIEELDESEINDETLKLIVKSTGTILSEAAKMFVAPIGFWVGIKDNAMDSNTSDGVIDSTEFALSFIPVVGNLIDFTQAFRGETAAGRELSVGERFLAAGTGTLGLAFDLTGVGYFIRSGGKLAVKGGTTVAKAAIRGGDDLLKASVKDSGFFVGGFKTMRGNTQANFRALKDSLAKGKIDTIKEYGTYAKQDMYNTLGGNMGSAFLKGSVRSFNWSVNKTGEKTGWDSFENFGNKGNLSKLEKTAIFNEANIQGKNPRDIKNELDIYFNNTKLTKNEILSKIDNIEDLNDIDKVKLFIKQMGITDKELISKLKSDNYDKNTLADLIVKKQNEKLNSIEFRNFTQHLANDIYANKKTYFNNDYISTHRNLSEVSTKTYNEENNLALFGKNPTGGKLFNNWYKNERISGYNYNMLYIKNSNNINLDIINLGASNGTDNIYKYIKDNKISNIDDLANQLKRDNKLGLNYSDIKDFKITRQAAEQAWDNAFSTKVKKLDTDINILEKEVKNLEKSATKIDDDMILTPAYKDEIIKAGSTLKSLENGPDTKKLFKNIDEYGDIKELKTKLDNYLTKHEAKIIEFKNDYKADKLQIENQIIELNNKISTLSEKAKPLARTINSYESKITILEGKLTTVKAQYTTGLSNLDSSKNQIIDAIGELKESSKKFDKTHKNTTELKNKKNELETKKEEKAEIENKLSESKSNEPLFKEVTELNIDSVHDFTINEYMKNPSSFISKGSTFDEVVNNIKNLNPGMNADELNHTSLYIWKLNNPDVGDSLKLFIEKLGLKNYNQISKALTNENGRHNFSQKLSELEKGLKSYGDKKSGTEYLTRLKEYNDLHFLGKNIDSIKEIFHFNKKISEGHDADALIRMNPNLEKIQSIPELSEYLKDPTKLMKTLGFLGKFSPNAKKIHDIAENIGEKASQMKETGKKVSDHLTKDIGK